VAALAYCALAAALAVPPGAARAFGFENVAQRAKALAAKSWEKPSARVPKELTALTYDQYRDIRFKPDRFLWRGAKLPFELAFFHTGFYFDQPVKINEVDAEGVHEIRFNPDDFNYGANKLDTRKIRNAGFAGLRVHHAVNTAKYKDEVLVFLGASYFRAVGKDQRYGSSARGLTVDTAESSGEEFPRFTEFWIERPAPGAAELVIYALLDTRSATGAYRFVLRPGVDTAIDVRARLYFRDSVRKLGIAPMSSMYFFGENQRSASPDYRPEVHDADGLSVQTGAGEWIWRPLVDPKRLLVTSFSTTDPLGFGLMQRDRAFSSYQDLEGRFELRPSVWIVPKGKWGAGRVELVQIPTPDETNDNIVAFWVPANPPGAKQTLELEYRVLWQKDRETRPPLAWVVQTRRGAGYVRAPDRGIALVVDFEGPVFKKLAPDAKVEGAFSVDGNAQLIENIAFPNEATGGWRVSLRLRRLDEKKPVELRGVLKSGGETISETWSYVLPAE
jgi:glucans biosynthesis protein